MPTRFGLRGFLMFLGGLEWAVSASQTLSGWLIFQYTLWQTTPWDIEDAQIVVIIAGLRIFKEVFNVISPLIELWRQPAQFDKNDACVRQVGALLLQNKMVLIRWRTCQN
jgi:hypothetical protein